MTICIRLDYLRIVSLGFTRFCVTAFCLFLIILWMNEWMNDRKSHRPIAYQMTWKSSTLDDLEGHWQPWSAILATAGLLVLCVLAIMRICIACSRSAFCIAFSHLTQSLGCCMRLCSRHVENEFANQSYNLYMKTRQKTTYICNY